MKVLFVIPHQKEERSIPYVGNNPTLAVADYQAPNSITGGDFTHTADRFGELKVGLRSLTVFNNNVFTMILRSEKNSRRRVLNEVNQKVHYSHYRALPFKITEKHSVILNGKVSF